jgi:large subunit ribosomal protein L6
MKMKIKEFEEKIEIPDGVELELEGRKVTLKGEKGEVTKTFNMPRFELKKEGNIILVKCKDYGKYDKRNFLTIISHIKNMAQGVKEGYIYKLKICSSHFPMNVALSGDKLVVKNLLGEKVPRELNIKKRAKVEVKGDIIEVSGPDKELVATVASDMEQLTRITNKDRRIFQDGIYITHKAGKSV